MPLDPAPSTELVEINMEFDGDPLGTIAMPVRDHINAATSTALMMSDTTSWVPKGTYIHRFIIQGGILTLQRNEAIQKMRGDWILFVDDDMVWRPKDIQRIVEAREEGDFDILGGLCFRRTPPFQPTLFMREGPTFGAYNFLEKWDSDIIEVDATGMAFVIIHKRVFEKIAGSPMPPLEERLQRGPTHFFRWEGLYGEDLRFCQDAKAAGCKVFVDTRIEIGHVVEVTVDHRAFLLELAFRPQAVVDERQRVNDEMGLPTMTKAEALAAVEAMTDDD